MPRIIKRDGLQKMHKIAKSILQHKKIIIVVFLLLGLVAAFYSAKVKINYDIIQYLPADLNSTQAVDLLADEFHDNIPNLNIAVPNLDLAAALALKEKIAAYPGVASITWLDDMYDLTQPLEIIPAEGRQAFFSEGEARYIVNLQVEDYSKAMQDLQELLGSEVSMSGQAVQFAQANLAAGEEICRIMLFAIPLALLILIFATRSYVEPLIFLLTVLIAVLFNMGTNIFLGEISFISQAVAAVLQMAVSMDYAIFMLNRFNQFRAEGDDVDTAMQKSMVKSFSSITASAATTFFGFLSLIFMRFELGPDLGIVLAKGIVFSLLSTFFFLPVLASLSYKLIDKTSHRSFLPSTRALRGFGRGVGKIAPLVLILVALLALPLYRAQTRINFLYGMSQAGAEQQNLQTQHIKDKFGDKQMLVLLVPRGEAAQEVTLTRALSDLPYIDSVTSYATSVGYELPPEIVPADQLTQLESANYSRIVVETSLASEGPKSFAAAQDLRDLVDRHYPEGETYWAGEVFSLLDMRDLVQIDNLLVNRLTIFFVGLILFFTFRSFSLPLILVFTIEFAIWCNLSTIYFGGRPLNYIGYLVISTIQLGATVDYGILMAEHYLDYRKKLAPRWAAQEAVTRSLPAILPPALILSLVGYILSLVSSLPVVADIGLVLGRGALFSLAAVILLLPSLLRLADPLIRYTSLAPGTWSLYGKDKLASPQQTEEEARQFWTTSLKTDQK